MANAISKLGAANKTHAVALAMRLGLISAATLESALQRMHLVAAGEAQQRPRNAAPQRDHLEQFAHLVGR
jgi:hypothetical protein